MIPLDELVAAAIHAPSADNNQPWRFTASGDTIRFGLDRGRALPSDVDSMFDLIALGAAIENCCIAALQVGLRPIVHYHSKPNGESEVDAEGQSIAHVEFQFGGVPDPLFPCLKSRCTSRLSYSTDAIAQRTLNSLGSSADAFAPVRLHWLADRERIRKFASICAQSDRIRFEHRPFHEELFRQLRFSRNSAETSRDGLDVRTLGLPYGAATLLRCLKPWPVMRWVHRLGLGRLLSAPSTITVRRSGTIGLLTIPQRSPEGFLEGGRAFQRIWLSAESHGLSLQPLGSLPIFLAMLERESPALPSQKRQAIERLRDQLNQLEPDTRKRSLLMAFRIGYGARPRQQSLRRPAANCITCDPSSHISVGEGALCHVD